MTTVIERPTTAKKLPPMRPSDRQLFEIPIADIIPDPDQPRKTFDAESLTELAESIAAKGVLQPLSVYRALDGKTFHLIYGERRYRASILAGKTMVPCLVLDGRPSVQDIDLHQLIENAQREDVKPLEEARAFVATMKLNGWTGKRLAEELGLSPQRISKAVCLTKLPAKVQELIEAGSLSASIGYALSSSEEDLAIRVAEAAVFGSWTRDQVVEHLQELQKPQAFVIPLQGQQALPAFSQPALTRSVPVGATEQPALPISPGDFYQAPPQDDSLASQLRKAKATVLAEEKTKASKSSRSKIIAGWLPSEDYSADCTEFNYEITSDGGLFPYGATLLLPNRTTWTQVIRTLDRMAHAARFVASLEEIKGGHALPGDRVFLEGDTGKWAGTQGTILPYEFGVPGIRIFWDDEGFRSNKRWHFPEQLRLVADAGNEVKP